MRVREPNLGNLPDQASLLLRIELESETMMGLGLVKTTSREDNDCDYALREKILVHGNQSSSSN